MSCMENEKAKKPRFLNLFDIIALLVALALVLAFFALRRSSRANTGAASGTVRYTIELCGLQNGAESLPKAGDSLVDKIKKYNIGKVVSAETEKDMVLSADLETGALVETEVTSQKNVLLVVEASCQDTAAQITVDGGFLVRVGQGVSVKGPGYAGSGYIVAIERSAA